jgi:hypothetical protein
MLVCAFLAVVSNSLLGSFSVATNGHWGWPLGVLAVFLCLAIGLWIYLQPEQAATTITFTPGIGECVNPRVDVRTRSTAVGELFLGMWRYIRPWTVRVTTTGRPTQRWSTRTFVVDEKYLDNVVKLACMTTADEESAVLMRIELGFQRAFGNNLPLNAYLSQEPVALSTIDFFKVWYLAMRRSRDWTGRVTEAYPFGERPALDRAPLFQWC